MFSSNRKEEETFYFKAKTVNKEKCDNPELGQVMEKINALTEQVNLMSKYLSYLSQKFDKTVDNAMTYDRTLDDIENRINSLKNKIEELEIVSPDVDLADDRNRAI